jgi:hypothetical protein
MGFNEDDRIRNKNVKYNLSYDLYSSLRQASMSDSDILSFVNAELLKENDAKKREVLDLVHDLATKINENYN